ncbi:MAG: dephospho-CoA kinase [Pseudomonadota bacterium]
MEFLTAEHACKHWGVAITGGIGAGKSTLIQLLEELGYTVVQADQLSRLIFVKSHRGYQKIIEAFGPGILDENREIDRKKLKDLTFADGEKKKRLESITQPLIVAELARALEETGILHQPRFWFYEAPVIIEAHRQNQFLATWLIVCPTFMRYQRIKLRDGMNDQRAKLSLNAQLSDAEKQKHADLVISTAGPLELCRYRIVHALNALSCMKFAPPS